MNGLTLTAKTMTSTQLADMLHIEKKHINESIRNMFQDKIDGHIIRPSKDSRGYVTEYHLPELESKMFVAKKDINYLEKITRYWIDQANAKPLLPSMPQNYLEALKALTIEVEAREELQIENQQQEQKLVEQAPKVLFADAVETSKSSILIGELAKIIKQNGIDGMGQNRLFSWMRENGYLIRRKGSDFNMPTQRSMDLKVMEIKIRTVINPDGSVRETKTTKVTGKGQSYFVNLFLGDD